MNLLKTIWKKILQFIPSSKARYILYALLFGFLIWLASGLLPGGKMGRETYVIARDSFWQPLNLFGKEKNIRAFSDDLLIEIAQNQKIRISIVEGFSGSLLDGLQRGSYDAVLTTMPPTPSNKQEYDFSDPYYLIGPVLIVPEWSTVESLKQLNDKIIGYPAGSSLAFELEQNSTILATQYDNILNALDNLSTGKIDGVIMDAVRGYAYTNGYYKGRLKVATAPLTKEGLRLVTMKDGKAVHLIEHFNEGLKSLRESGKYKELLEKWGLIDIQP
jgi:polar amino acid transport system substrate-binding protein